MSTSSLGRATIPAVGSLALALLLMLAGAGAALAHAYLVRSTPAANAVLDAPPDELRLWLAEPVEVRFSQVQVLDREGKRVAGVGPVRGDPADPTLMVAPLEALPPGVYAVAWRALSAVDGHPTSGSFVFAVGRDQVPAGGLTAAGSRAGEDSGSSTLALVARWLGYLAMAVLFGGFAFYPLVLQPALESADPRSSAPGGSGEAGVRIQPRDLPLPPLLLPLLLAGWAGAMAMAGVGALAQAAASSGVGPAEAVADGSLAALLFGTRYGGLFWVRLLLLVPLGALLFLFRRRIHRGEAVPARWWWAGVGPGALVLLAASAGSHAAGQGTLLSIVVQWTHGMMATLWLGGLVMLAVTLPWAHRTLGPKSSVAVARVVGYFSELALVFVPILATTGVSRALSEVGDPHDLLDTPYGTALLVKLGLLVPLLGLAAANLLLIKRRLVATAESGESDAAMLPWYARLRHTVGGEILLLAAVLLATAVVTGLPPARTAFGAGLVARSQTEDLRLVVAVDPGQPGFNAVDVHVMDGLGRPVADAEKVAVLFSTADRNLGETEAVAENLGDGRYLVQGGYLSTPGTWRAQVLVRRPGREDLRATMELRLPGGASH